jgi:hypothetical protein
MITEINKLTNNIKKINIQNIENEYLDCLELYDVEIIDYIFLAIHNYSFDELKYEQKLKRINQYKFRQELIDLYKGCIITKVSNFEACHIVPFSICDNNEKYDPNNGILLKSDLHELFDEYIFSINPETLCVEFDEDFFTDPNNKIEYFRFNNMAVELTKNDSLVKNLTIHYNIFQNRVLKN